MFSKLRIGKKSNKIQYNEYEKNVLAFILLSPAGEEC